MQPTSSFFDAVAKVLKLIESLNTPSDWYGVVDSGETLELCSTVYTLIKDSSEFQAFEAQGGNYYCFDDDGGWEVQ
jgi:hypothetical protein